MKFRKKKSKGKKHIAQKEVVFEANVEWNDPKDDQLLIHRKSKLRNMYQTPATSIPSDADTCTMSTSVTTTPELALEPTQPQPRLLNRLKSDEVCIIIGEKILSVEGFDKYPDVMAILSFY